MASPNTLTRRDWERELEGLTVGKFVPFILNSKRKNKKEYIKTTGKSGNNYRKFLKKQKRLAKIKLDELKTLALETT